MFQQMKKRIKNEKGLTLIELLAVVVILAIVAAIAVPAIGNIIDNSRYKAVKADAVNVLNAAQLYYTDNPGGEPATGSAAEETTTSITVAGLIEANFLESAGKIPTDASVTMAQPHELTATVENAVGSKTVTFTDATLTGINADIQKGSDDTLEAIAE